MNSKITPRKSDIEKETNLWEDRILGIKEKVSELTLQVRDLEKALSVFHGMYNAKVGVLYVELDKLKLSIEEYRHRINIARKSKGSSTMLQDIEEEVDKTFSDNRQRVKDIEEEASESYEEYEKQREEEEIPLSNELQEELKQLYRKLALKFHPDRAKDEEQRREFHEIMSEVNKAYDEKDFETLKRYEEKADREERIVGETPEEKLERLKEEYNSLLKIIEKLHKNLSDLKTSEIYKLREKVEQAKERGTDLLGELAAKIKKEIEETKPILEQLIAEYMEIMKRAEF
jgi:curved DNA-binding protein CbpA